MSIFECVTAIYHAFQHSYIRHAFSPRKIVKLFVLNAFKNCFFFIRHRILDGAPDTPVYWNRQFVPLTYESELGSISETKRTLNRIPSTTVYNDDAPVRRLILYRTNNRDLTPFGTILYAYIDGDRLADFVAPPSERKTTIQIRFRALRFRKDYRA